MYIKFLNNMRYELENLNEYVVYQIGVHGVYLGNYGAQISRNNKSLFQAHKLRFATYYRVYEPTYHEYIIVHDAFITYVITGSVVYRIYAQYDASYSFSWIIFDGYAQQLIRVHDDKCTLYNLDGVVVDSYASIQCKH